MIAKQIGRLWPRNLQGQLLLAVALTLLLAQGISAVLIRSAQNERRDAALIHTAAMRLLPVLRGDVPLIPEDSPITAKRGRGMRLEQAPSFAPGAADQRDRDGEGELRRVLTEQGVEFEDVIVVTRDLAQDQHAQRRFAERERLRPGLRIPRPDGVMLAAVRADDHSQWLVARVMIPRPGMRPGLTLMAQTLLLYGLLVGVIALLLGRLTRPLSALTARVEHFAGTRAVDGQLAPQGPEDVRRLIVAHNAMEGRIASLLDEKDVMLGAIGHDLKTPLAALRVRIEGVEDEGERARMAATIEDIVRSLDDILSLARVGRSSDPREPTELSALVAQVTEEFEDLGEPVTLVPAERIVLPLRPTWLRRALRNLVSNALRYGNQARIAIERDAGTVTVRVDDDGPGIAEADIERMQEPFARGDPSRNSATGGAGLGLALARAIAEQHGGRLALVNRIGDDGQVAGLSARLILPI